MHDLILVVQVTNHSAVLHYRSTRPGLGPFVVGICQGVGSTVYNLHDINFESLRSLEDGSCDHEVKKYHGGMNAVYLHLRPPP
jgi:hypothetical protein